MTQKEIFIGGFNFICHEPLTLLERKSHTLFKTVIKLVFFLTFEMIVKVFKHKEIRFKVLMYFSYFFHGIHLII